MFFSNVYKIITKIFRETLQKKGPPAMMQEKRIYIGAAHTEQNPGARAGALEEYSISLDVHKGIGEILRQHTEILHTFLLKTLSERLDIVRAAKDAVLYFEPHCNNLPENPKARGYYIIIQAENTVAKKCAQKLLEGLAALPLPRVRDGICYHNNGRCWFENGPTWFRTKIAALEELSIPSLIVEMCYLSNEMDRLWIEQPEHRYLFGNVLGRWLVDVWNSVLLTEK